jgi:hypothetical protein
MKVLLRDPRISPITGDVISRDFMTAKGGCIIRGVTRAHGGFVFFCRDNGYAVKNQIVSLEQWCKWARKAELLNSTEAVEADEVKK